MDRIMCCLHIFFFFFFPFFIVFQELQIENNWIAWHSRNPFDYSGNNETVKLGLAEWPYALCQIILVTQAQLCTCTRTQLFGGSTIDFQFLNMNLRNFMPFRFKIGKPAA